MIDLLKEAIYQKEEQEEFEGGLIHCKDNDNFTTALKQTLRNKPEEIITLDIDKGRLRLEK